MINPIFADKVRHTSKQSTLSGTEIIEQSILSITNTGIFTVGEPLFISDADGSDVQGLGLIISKDASTLDVEIGLDKQYAAGSTVWTPNTYVILTESYSYPVKSPDFVIPEVFSETISGVMYAEKVGTSWQQFDLKFDSIADTQYRELVAWYISMNGFATAFYFIDPDEATYEVRLRLDKGFSDWEEVAGYWSGALILRVEP